MRFQPILRNLKASNNFTTKTFIYPSSHTFGKHDQIKF